MNCGVWAMDRTLLRHGFILILLALLTGLVIPAVAIPRLGLSAHTIGLMGGILLIAIASVWQRFELSGKQRAVLYFSWLYSSYVNWLACLLGAIVGAGNVTPVASGGQSGPDYMEVIVAILLGSVALASFVAVGLSLYGLKSAAPGAD